MSLSIYDTLTREKREFIPADPSRVTLYVCGPTVYNYAHIGNARPVVVFDLLFRLLRHTYGRKSVVYARNITDVDDKINQAAIDQGVDISVITDKFAAIYEADMAALGALSPTFQPRATGHIDEMIAMIGHLIEQGHAYPAEGHVLFDVSSFADYGKLSGRSLDDMIAGARVEVAPYKKNAADFVLWKPSKPGEPVWKSPWGEGRPGWHIECSAMIETVLGLPIDIHGGGHDLIFPHHENELAQGACSAPGGRPFANYWMHNGFLTMESEKMSKSLGNVRLVHDLIKEAPGEALRWALLSAHYRAPLDWTGDLIAQSRKSLDRLYGVLQRSAASENDNEAEVPDSVLEALNDDLATPRAMAELFALAKEVETATNRGARGDARAKLLAAGKLMGFLMADPNAWFEGQVTDDMRKQIEGLLAERAQARADKNWPEADRIRGDLTALGVEVLDGSGGAASWRFRDTGD
jgi:cysteinyl-tRNA synthetase